MSEDSIIRTDRMRFTKNTLSSRLALAGIAFNVLFFVSIYKVNHSAYYTYWMGISIIYNLVFMLSAFLASEGTKNYKPGYSFLLILLAAGQIARIFIYPARMRANPEIEGPALILVKTVVTEANGVVVTEETSKELLSQYVRVVAYLSLSATCLLAGAVINLYRSRVLAAHKAGLGLQKA